MESFEYFSFCPSLSTMPCCTVLATLVQAFPVRPAEAVQVDAPSAGGPERFRGVP